ncbi:hypothetical protein [Nocardia sp. NPDC057668]|uniref:hypothetical protein n=1 Tax=Nocardia sp. NPDC057668 TaxID=3346202 RepID=UPI00366C2DD1
MNPFAYALQVVAVGALAVAWLAIGRALYSESGADPGVKLEAGGRFAANFTVYWPFLLVVSPLVFLTAIFGLLPYRFAPGGAITGGLITSLFAQFVGAELHLFGFEPGIAEHLDTSLAASCFALATAFAAACRHFYDGRSGRTRAAWVRGGAALSVVLVTAAMLTIPPLIGGSGTPSGVLADRVTDRNCGRNWSDWIDATRTTVYAGDVKQTDPPKDVPDNAFGVVVTLRTGAGKVETTPPTAISFRDDEPLRPDPPNSVVLLHRSGTGNTFAFTELRDPTCEAGGTRVVSASYKYADYGTASGNRIEGRVTRGD